MKIAFLACSTTLPGAPDRRGDAFEHDQQMAALTAVLAPSETVTDIDWRAPLEDFAGFDIALIGTPWDYQDNREAFLAKLEAIAALGVPVCNAPEVVRWNIDKGYLAQLAERGVATIPTLLMDNPGRAEILAAFDHFSCDRVIAKRRVGAGAEGQYDFTRGSPPLPDWQMGHPALVQPFLPAIVEEGEHSLIFIDGQFQPRPGQAARQQATTASSRFMADGTRRSRQRLPIWPQLKPFSPGSPSLHRSMPGSIWCAGQKVRCS